MNRLLGLLSLGILMMLQSCSTEQLVLIPETSFNFQLLNYTDQSFQNATLFIGGKDSNGNFVATDSIQYSQVPSNVSPNGLYTFLDDCTLGCGSEGLVDGYHYYFQNGQQFVDIPFSPENNSWNPDIERVLEISDTLAFVLRLAGGQQAEISGFNIRTTLVNNPYPVVSLVHMRLTENGIEGRTSL